MKGYNEGSLNVDHGGYLILSCTLFKRNSTNPLIVIQLLFLSFEMMLLLMCFSVSTWGTKLYKIRSSFYLFVFTVFGGIF